MKPSNNLENETPSDTHGRIQLVCKKFQAHSSLEPPLDTIRSFEKSSFVMIFLTLLGATEIVCSFRLVLERKTGKEMPEWSRLEFLEEFSGNNFALSDAEDNSSGSLNTGGIVNLSLLRTLLEIRQKSPKAKFLGSGRFFCCVSVSKFGSFKNPFTIITSLSELCFRFRRFTLLVKTKKVISMKYGSCKSEWKPWVQVRLDLILSMKDIYINFNLNPLKKLISSNRSTDFNDILLWNISLKWSQRPSHQNSHKLYNETGHFVVNLIENQWKLRQQHDQNFPMERKPL